ncbi:hypothetical protein [Paenisporosarcina quisquiliarum]|uniref:hypothetical protein n=1 Tax=Paenisporosarcina quisquiliarum TaxID=365346 RepID=UPI003736A4BE
MLKRKMLAFLLTYLSIVLILSLLLVTDNNMYSEFFLYFVLIGAYSLPFILLYGVPSSIFADYLTKKLVGLIRSGVSLLIHLAMGMVIVVIAGIIFENKSLLMNFKSFLSEYLIFLFPTLLAAFLFWLSDEMLRSTFIRNKLLFITKSLDKYWDLKR